jgi:hypothetical protein
MPVGINGNQPGVQSGQGNGPKIDTSKLSSENQQLVQETLGLLQKDSFSSKLLADAEKRGTPISFNNSGLQGGQAASTQIKSDGTSKVTLGTQAIDKQTDKASKIKAIAGMIGNELHSVSTVGEMAKTGKGIKSSGTKMQEGASFITDGIFQGIVDKGQTGNNVPNQPQTGTSKVSAKEGSDYVKKEFGTSIGNVLNKAGSYSGLPTGDVSSTGFDEFVKLGIMDQTQADEAKQEMTSVLSGGSGNGGGTTMKAGKTSKVDASQLKDELSGNKPSQNTENKLAGQQPEEGKKVGDLILKD